MDFEGVKFLAPKLVFTALYLIFFVEFKAFCNNNNNNGYF